MITALRMISVMILMNDDFHDIGDGFGVDGDNDNERNCQDIVSDHALTSEGPRYC